MKNFRIIPRLEIKDRNLIKGIRLEGLRKIGDPKKFALKYQKDLADEIFFDNVSILITSPAETSSLPSVTPTVDVAKECIL